VTFFSQSSEPVAIDLDPQEFSFQGYAGAVAWGVGVENYANVRFKTPYFDAQLYQKITIYNDIGAAFFAGMTMSSGILDSVDSYDCFIIRYILRRNRNEICAEVTATNNWLLAQMKIDGILEASIYLAAASG